MDYPELKHVHPTILENFEWWNYIQRSIGYGSISPPQVQRPVPACKQLQHLIREVWYLQDQFEVLKATAGIMIQQRFPLDE